MFEWGASGEVCNFALALGQIGVSRIAYNFVNLSTHILDIESEAVLHVDLDT